MKTPREIPADPWAERDTRNRQVAAEIAELAAKLRVSGGECDAGQYGIFRIEMVDGRVFTKAGIHGWGGIFRLEVDTPERRRRLIVQVLNLMRQKQDEGFKLMIYLAEKCSCSEVLYADPGEVSRVALMEPG